MQAYAAVVFATKADEREREEPAFESDAKPSSGRSIEGLVALRYTQHTVATQPDNHHDAHMFLTKSDFHYGAAT